MKTHGLIDGNGFRAQLEPDVGMVLDFLDGDRFNPGCDRVAVWVEVFSGSEMRKGLSTLQASKTKDGDGRWAGSET